MTSIKGPHLANLYTEGIPDQARMMKYLEEGVQRGNTHCNSRLGCLAARSGDHKKAKRCLMTAARSGHDKALHNLMVSYREEPGSMVSKDDLDTTLRAHKAVIDTGKNEAREYAMRHKAFAEKLTIKHEAL